MQQIINFIAQYPFIMAAPASLLLFLRPVRAFLGSLLKSSWTMLLYVAVSMALVPVGGFLAVNAYTLLVSALLGLPGILLLIVLRVFF